MDVYTAMLNAFWDTATALAQLIVPIVAIWLVLTWVASLIMGRRT